MKGKAGYDDWEPIRPVRSRRNGALRYCTVLEVGKVRMKLRYRTPDRGRHHGHTWEPVATPDEVELHPNDLNALCYKRVPGYRFKDLVDALGGYRPTICPRDAWDYVLIHEYNKYQRSRRDPRRVDAPGASKLFCRVQEAADLWAARRYPTETFARR